MTQLKKKLFQLRIHRFFKRNKLVLFFHYDFDKNKDYKRYAQHLRCQKQVSALEQAEIILVKNKIAQTLIPLCYICAERTNLGKTGLKTDENTAINKQHKPQSFYSTCLPQTNRTEENGKLFESDSKKSQNIKNMQQSALFRGPSALFGFSDISCLASTLQTYKQQNGFVLFGAFYKDQVINHIQVERLSTYGQRGKSSLILECVRSIEEPLLKVLWSMRDGSHVPCLSQVQHRLLFCLLQGAATAIAKRPQ